jgi:hypothetical protein
VVPLLLLLHLAVMVAAVAVEEVPATSGWRRQRFILCHRLASTAPSFNTSLPTGQTTRKSFGEETKNHL